jgi:hypothetical protein
MQSSVYNHTTKGVLLEFRDSNSSDGQLNTCPHSSLRIPEIDIIPSSTGFYSIHPEPYMCD